MPLDPTNNRRKSDLVFGPDPRQEGGVLPAPKMTPVGAQPRAQDLSIAFDPVETLNKPKSKPLNYPRMVVRTEPEVVDPGVPPFPIVFACLFGGAVGALFVFVLFVLL